MGWFDVGGCDIGGCDIGGKDGVGFSRVGIGYGFMYAILEQRNPDVIVFQQRYTAASVRTQ